MTGKEAGMNKNGSADERNAMEKKKKKLKALLKMEIPKTGSKRERGNEGAKRGRVSGVQRSSQQH